MTGVVLGGGAGAALALLPPGPAAGATVAACWPPAPPAATLTAGWRGTGGRAAEFGAILNEVGDRAALADCLAFAPVALVLAAALVATLPSWVALAGAAAGLGRIQGGPVGKTERCLLLALLAAIGFPLVFLGMLADGTALTAVVRLARLGGATAQQDRPGGAGGGVPAHAPRAAA